jgi:hypothetical protein
MASCRDVLHFGTAVAIGISSRCGLCRLESAIDRIPGLANSFPGGIPLATETVRMFLTLRSLAYQRAERRYRYGRNNIGADFQHRQPLATC